MRENSIPVDIINTTEQEVSTTRRRQNFICNFRAPNKEQFQIWKNLKKAVRDRGLDICYLMLSLCSSWLKSIEQTATTHEIAIPTQIINLQQQNTFVYSVQIPKRKPFEIICSQKMPTRTIWSLAFQAYIMEKARDLECSFSFRDFPELGHDFFRKCIFSLKRRGKILPLRPRSNPRFYILTEWVSAYPTMNENNEVKPRFTQASMAIKRREGDS